MSARTEDSRVDSIGNTMEARLEAARKNAELASAQLQSANEEAERALEAHRAAKGGRGAVRVDSGDEVCNSGSHEEKRQSKKGSKTPTDGGDGAPGGEVPLTKRFIDDDPFGPVWGDYCTLAN